MSTRTDGIAGLDFVEDMIKHIKDEWPSTSGKTPIVSAQWKIKEVGHVEPKYSEIIISLDSENPRIFSLITDVGTDGKFNYDWLHDISITLDLRTGISQNRIDEMVNGVMSIFKNNVATPIINSREYIQILPSNVVSLNEEYRNLFRYTVDIEAMRFNP